MWKPGHGLDELTRLLDALDGRVVHVQALRGNVGAGASQAGSSDDHDETYVRLLAQEVVVSELAHRGL